MDRDAAVIEGERLSKWYGHVLGVSDISFRITGGVVGLLGPNGAGKSTLMKMIAGLLRPSRGSLRVFGQDPFTSLEAKVRVGYCPEHERSYDELTAVEMVTAMAELSGIPTAEARKRAIDALKRVGLAQAMGRRIAHFSKGMRQRTKLATTMVHDPDLILLDEPLTGVDPVARAEIVARIRELGAAGKTVLVSSHVLYEIEALTDEILVIYRGQVLAEGNIYRIRELIDRHPHRIRIECDDARTLGCELGRGDHVSRVHFERDAVIVETADPGPCYDQIAAIALERRLAIRSLTSPDNNLGAVFDYLTGVNR